VDLLRAIHEEKHHCPLHLFFKYVASHQDDLLQFEDLSPLAQLNVQADFMAKQVLHILGQQQTAPLLLPLPRVPWVLTIDSLPTPLDL